MKIFCDEFISFHFVWMSWGTFVILFYSWVRVLRMSWRMFTWWTMRYWLRHHLLNLCSGLNSRRFGKIILNWNENCELWQSQVAHVSSINFFHDELTWLPKYDVNMNYSFSLSWTFDGLTKSHEFQLVMFQIWLRVCSRGSLVYQLLIYHDHVVRDWNDAVSGVGSIQAGNTPV